jgi:hypothetical protein
MTCSAPPSSATCAFAADHDGRYDAAANQPRDFDTSQSDAAGRSGDEHRLAGL